MKKFVLTALIGAFIAAAGTANAQDFITDPLLKDLAANGSVINPHGSAAGR